MIEILLHLGGPHNQILLHFSVSDNKISLCFGVSFYIPPDMPVPLEQLLRTPN